MDILDIHSEEDLVAYLLMHDPRTTMVQPGQEMRHIAYWFWKAGKAKLIGMFPIDGDDYLVMFEEYTIKPDPFEANSPLEVVYNYNDMQLKEMQRSRPECEL